MDIKPIVGGRVFQGGNLSPEIPSGFSQKGGAIRPHLPGDFVKNTNSVLTPPTVSPELTIDNDLFSYYVDFFWTETNKMGSPGFYFDLQYELDDSGIWVSIYTGSDLNFSYDFSTEGSGSYEFRVVTNNSAGEGAISNVVSKILPGESSNLHRLIEDGADRLLEDGTVLLLG